MDTPITEPSIIPQLVSTALFIFLLPGFTMLIMLMVAHVTKHRDLRGDPSPLMRAILKYQRPICIIGGVCASACVLSALLLPAAPVVTTIYLVMTVLYVFGYFWKTEIQAVRG